MADNDMQKKPAIEKLLDFFVTSDGTGYYKVKWAPTWETAESLSQFTNLIDEFWKFINSSHESNFYNNHSIIKKPDPVFPQRNSEPPMLSFANTPPHKPTVQRTHSSPSTPQQNLTKSASATISTPQRRPSSSAQTQRSPTNPTASTYTHRNSSSNAPASNVPPNGSQKSTVIIDSDEEDDSQRQMNLNSFQSTMQQQTPAMIVNQMPLCSDPNKQQQYPMSPPWGATIKTEEVDTKPLQQSPANFIANQMHQQFQFPLQSPSRDGASRGHGSTGSPGGRGRGVRGGGMSPAKRKLSMPATGSPSLKQPFGDVKSESFGDLNSLTQESKPGLSASSPSSENVRGNWEDNFEILEKRNFDGTQLALQYKCKVCDTVISNKSSCKRHFNIHSGEPAHMCPICQKAFYRLDYLQRHLKTHGQGGGKELEGLIKLAMDGVKK